MLAFRQQRFWYSDIKVVTELAKLSISNSIWLIERHLKAFVWLTWGGKTVRKGKNSVQWEWPSCQNTMGLFNTSLHHYTCEVTILLSSKGGVTTPPKSTVFSSEAKLTKNFKHHKVIWFYRIHSPKMQILPSRQPLPSLPLSNKTTEWHSISKTKTQLHEGLTWRDVGDTGLKEKLNSNVFIFLGCRRKGEDWKSFLGMWNSPFSFLQKRTSVMNNICWGNAGRLTERKKEETSVQTCAVCCVYSVTLCIAACF